MAFRIRSVVGLSVMAAVSVVLWTVNTIILVVPMNEPESEGLMIPNTVVEEEHNDMAKATAKHGVVSVDATTTTTTSPDDRTDTNRHSYAQDTKTNDSNKSLSIPTNQDGTAVPKDHHGSNNNNNNIDETMNGFHLDALHVFLDWEMESLQSLVDTDQSLSLDNIRFNNTGCRPPHGISPHCCVGANSRYRWQCRRKTFHDYHRVKDIADRHMLPLYRQSSKEDHSNTTTCDVCKILTMLFRHDLTMIVLGDSISRQSILALVCSWQRLTMSSNTRYNRYHITLATAPDDERSHRIHLTDWWTNTTKMISFHNHYLRPTPEDFAGPLDRADVLVVSYGMHWSRYARRKKIQPANLEEGWEQTMAYAKNATSFPRLLAIRETSVQHFDGPDGDFFGALELNKEQVSNNNKTSSVTEQGQCVPINQTRFFSWRDTMVRRVLKRVGLSTVWLNDKQQEWWTRVPKEREVVILPFREYTKELYFMHLLDKDSTDCTHFCYSHYLWQPLWRSLRLAMERSFERGDTERGGQSR